MKPKVNVEMWMGPSSTMYPHGDPFLRVKIFKAAGTIDIPEEDDARGFYISMARDTKDEKTWFVSRLIVEGFNKFDPSLGRYKVPLDVLDAITEVVTVKAMVEWGTYEREKAIG